MPIRSGRRYRFSCIFAAFCVTASAAARFASSSPCHASFRSGWISSARVYSSMAALTWPEKSWSRIWSWMRAIFRWTCGSVGRRVDTNTYADSASGRSPCRRYISPALMYLVGSFAFSRHSTPPPTARTRATLPMGIRLFLLNLRRAMVGLR